LRLLPSASALVIQRGALPRPVQVSLVSGWRYLAGTLRFTVGVAFLGLRALAPARTPPVFLLYAAVISSGVISYSRMDRTMEVRTGPRCLACNACACFCSFCISFSIFCLSTEYVSRVIKFPVVNLYRPLLMPFINPKYL